MVIKTNFFKLIQFIIRSDKEALPFIQSYYVLENCAQIMIKQSVQMMPVFILNCILYNCFYALVMKTRSH